MARTQTYRIDCTVLGARYDSAASLTIDADDAEVPRTIANALRESFEVKHVELSVVEQRTLPLDVEE